MVQGDVWGYFLACFKSAKSWDSGIVLRRLGLKFTYFLFNKHSYNTYCGPGSDLSTLQILTHFSRTEGAYLLLSSPFYIRRNGGIEKIR